MSWPGGASAARQSVHAASPETGVSATPVDAVLRLVSRLRGAGVPVSSDEAIDAVRALTCVDLVRRRPVWLVLRCTLLKDPAHAAAFDRAFDATFARPRRCQAHRGDAPGAGTGPSPGAVADELARALREGDDARAEQLARDAAERWAGLGDNSASAVHHAQRLLRTLDLNRVLRALLGSGGAGESDADRRIRTAAARDQVEQLRELLARLVAERLPEQASGARGGADPVVAPEDRLILTASADELAELRAAVRPLARRIATRLRRPRRHGRGDLDMRNTIRRSMSSGGIPVEPVLRRRLPHRPDLVMLCDVSGSMAAFAPFALALTHALQAEFARTRSWVFVDGIAEVTGILHGSGGYLDPYQLLGNRGLVSGDGRSDYAAALGAFVRTWRDVLTPRATVLIVGDARSHERGPAVRELAELARLARRVYWLNPEPRADWDTDDSRIALYQRCCAGVFEVATLRQLESCVAEIAR
jgi:uncharacterized protein with von Willebrand factor type A (vWA) domain